MQNKYIRSSLLSYNYAYCDFLSGILKHLQYCWWPLNVCLCVRVFSHMCVHIACLLVSTCYVTTRRKWLRSIGGFSDSCWSSDAANVSWLWGNDGRNGGAMQEVGGGIGEMERRIDKANGDGLELLQRDWAVVTRNEQVEERTLE